MRSLVVLGLSLAALSIASGCANRVTPLQLQAGAHGTLFHAQMAPDDWTVAGLRLSLGDGWNRDVYGLDLGTLNQTARRGAGIQVGIVTDEVEWYSGLQVAAGMNLGYAGLRRGAQIAGLLNQGGSDMWGMQLSTGGNYAERLTGLQVGLINVARALRGIELGGIYNDCFYVTGAQVGLINECTRARGVQFGLLNFNRSGFLPLFPGINFSVGHRDVNAGDYEVWR